MSPVLPLPLGTMLFIVQVAPPLVETKIGAVVVAPVGFFVKAEPAICRRFPEFTERFGSLSCPVSLLCALGIMLITVTCARDIAGMRLIPIRNSASFVLLTFMDSPLPRRSAPLRPSVGPEDRERPRRDRGLRLRTGAAATPLRGPW